MKQAPKKAILLIFVCVAVIGTALGIQINSAPTIIPSRTPTQLPQTPVPTPTSTQASTPTPTPKPTSRPITTSPTPITIINPTIEPTPAPEINPLSNLTNKKAVIIIFDDGWLDQYTNAYPILQQYGYPASFAVISSYVQGQYPAYMSWSNLANLQTNGFDIVSHSLSHKRLDYLDNDTLYAEVAGSQSLLAAHGINTNIFVYPYGQGANNDTVRAVVSQFYAIARGTNETSLNLSSYDKYDLPAYAISSNTTIAKFGIYTNHELTLIFYHHITANITDGSMVSPSQLIEEMQFLKENGYIVATLKDLSEII